MNGETEAGTLTLKHKVALCAGLMASEAMCMFNNLNEMPLLQALGSPVYLLTLPGTISASLGLVLVPLLGWLADGGSHPRHRKKPITIAVFCLGWLGMYFGLAAVTRHTQETTSNHETINVSVNTLANDLNGSQAVGTVLENQIVLSGFDLMTSSATDIPGDSKLLKRSSETESTLSSEPSVVLGLSMPVILCMAGFLFMDLSFDLTNSSVKALMLTHSAPADHVNLLVIGVVMAALGGCVTSISSLVDLGRILPDIEPICSQAIVQLVTLIILSGVCCTCSVLSSTRAPLLADSPHGYQESNEEWKRNERGTEETGTLTARTLREGQESVFYASMVPGEAIMSNSTQLERSFRSLSLSTALSSSHTLYPHSSDIENVPLLQRSASCDVIPDNIAATTPTSSNAGCLSSRNIKLFVIWLTAFFSACSMYFFNVTVADYVGKVIYGGNPFAEADSEDYMLYQGGTRTAALCVLILNIAYVMSALFQNKVLSVLSPKAEYVVVSVTQMILILIVRQTANLMLLYVTSAVVGLNRTTMLTVPFIFATQLCQQAQAQKSAQGSESTKGLNGFGSTMALATSALPLAYLVTTAIIGPLVDATGDPSAPMMITVVCSLLAAVTVCCYKS